jgi:Zn-dependent M28 family amino/carboxypeptidase
MRSARVPVLLALAFAACHAPPPDAPVSPAPGAASLAAGSAAAPSPPKPADGFDDAERTAAAAITPGALAARTRYLSDDLLEGRAPGSRGDDLAIKFVAADLEASGLAPGAEGGKSFLQKVPLVGVTAKVPARVDATTPKGPLPLRVPDDLVVMSGVQKKDVVLPAADVVFVGYGIVAPELGWDDYKDVDVRGKVVVVMNNDPESDPALFGGTTRLWYGRWDYKYAQAAKKGAAGVLLIHTDHSAGYPWQVVVTSNNREKFELPADDAPRLAARMWITEDSAKKLAAQGGEDLDRLRAAAEKRDFRPTPLHAKFGISFTNTLRSLESANVLGVLPGADPELAKEVVVYTAHHDHLGIGAPRGGDSIYNGAVDNASGVAALLSIARAAAAGPRPKRSLLFIAVTAEEQGLLGSEWYCAHPTFAPGRIAADLNMDSMNVFGKTTDVGFIGLGRSSLDAVVLGVARAQGRSLHGDAFPDRGAFYRSDQFSFAKIGVPSIYVKGGPSFAGRPAGYGEEVTLRYERTHYHQPSDEMDPAWDWSGAAQDAQLLLVAGSRIANAPALPAWNAGDEFARIVRAK